MGSEMCIRDRNSSSYNKYTTLVQLNDSTVVVAFEGKDNDGMIQTLKIKADGIITKLKKFEHDTNLGQHNALVRVDDNTVALAYYASNKGTLKTFDIAADGTITQVASKDFSTGSNAGKYNQLVRLNTNIFVLAYSGVSADGFIAAYDISPAGKPIALKNSWEQDEA